MLGGGAVVAHASNPPPKPSRQPPTPSTPVASRTLRSLNNDTPLSALVWTVPVIPKSVSWISNTAADPWTLFDGEGRPALASPPTPTNWTLAITLDGRSPLSALSLRGPARGTLSVVAKDDSGLHPIPEWTQRAVVARAGWEDSTSSSRLWRHRSS